MCNRSHYELSRPQRLTGSLLWFLLLTLTALLYAAQAKAQAPESAPSLTIPSWDLCTGPEPEHAQMACFTQDGVRQLLRIQEQARYTLELSTLNTRLTQTFQQMIAELEGAQQRYRDLRDVIEERNASLRESLIAATAEAEKYRARAERRKIWPWVSLGLGLVVGALGTMAVAR